MNKINVTAFISKDLDVMKTKKGFTLIELLVVISIIALLMAILMPALGKVRRMAQQTVCLSNLRSQGLAFAAYATDNDDSFTRGHQGWGPDKHPGSGWGYWLADLKPYRGDDIDSLVCPSVPRINPGYEIGQQFGVETMGWTDTSAAWPWAINDLPSQNGMLLQAIPVSYTMSVWASNPEEGSVKSTGTVNSLRRPVEFYWRKTSNVSDASNVPMFGDGRWLEGGVLSEDRDFGIGRAVLDPPETEENARLNKAKDNHYNWGMGQFCVPRHSDGTNMVFADFSARKLKLTELWGLKWYNHFDRRNKYVEDSSLFPSWIK
ncbi:putative major pilin subunit [Limihaloglobus sulfuriphilus]|uniref:Putative major pilin subunit n=2 Tax=Limihaloglobus sulfuriphilus TaxID=1851148 RepID=A0A1Q2MIX0_9BACT|nr:putative major pilin subunit [Limihaloglobus sulfuriphilus]